MASKTVPGSGNVRTAAEPRGDNFKGFNNLNLKAKARI